MNDREQRRALRVAFREPVSFGTATGASGGCLAYDISESGIRINLNDFVPLNTEMGFQVQLEKDQPLVDVKGRVVWVQRVPFSERYQAGLQFEEDYSYPQSKERIHQYIHSRRF